MAIFRRVGIKAHWRFAVSVGGSWLCFGRLDQQKIQNFFLARLGWFSVADVTRDFWNCAFLADTTAGVWPIGLGVEHQAQIRSFFLLYRTGTPPSGA